MNRYYRVRNVAKAALRFARATGDITVRVENPARMGTKLRHLKPIITRGGNVAVRVFNGIWLVSATVHRHIGYDGQLLRKLDPADVSAPGRAYKGQLNFDVKHVLWLDEHSRTRTITPNQLSDAVDRVAWQAQKAQTV